MSATNRGTVRNTYDYYATPMHVVDNLLDNLDLSRYGNKVLEPSAGCGNITYALRQRYPEKNVLSLEVRAQEHLNLSLVSNEVVIGDFLRMICFEKFDIIIGNPPYSNALEFVTKSLELLSDNGILIFLLRTAFLESKRRYDFWQENPLNGLYTLSSRPSFTGHGTDATSYSWFIWDKSTNSQYIKII